MTARTRGPRIFALERRPVATVKPARRQSRRPQPAQPLEFLGAIRAAVERGAALLAVGCAPAERDGFWADLLGAIAGPEPPLGEYYARVTEAHSHISARVTREFAVVDGFVPLI